jgi:hypothetical protein
MKQSGYDSEKSSDILKLYPTDQNVEHSELENMKKLLKKAKSKEEAAEKKGIMKESEVSHYYKIVKATPD